MLTSFRTYLHHNFTVWYDTCFVQKDYFNPNYCNAWGIYWRSLKGTFFVISTEENTHYLLNIQMSIMCSVIFFLKPGFHSGITAIRMTSSSRDIYFHTPSRNQTMLWPFEKNWLENFMFVPSLFLINSSSSFCLLLLRSSATDIKCFWPFNSKKLLSVKSKLKSAIDVDWITVW